jgi:hypothetical protein
MVRTWDAWVDAKRNEVVAARIVVRRAFMLVALLMGLDMYAAVLMPL